MENLRTVNIIDRTLSPDSILFSQKLGARVGEQKNRNKGKIMGENPGQSSLDEHLLSSKLKTSVHLLWGFGLSSTHTHRYEFTEEEEDCFPKTWSHWFPCCWVDTPVLLCDFCLMFSQASTKTNGPKMECWRHGSNVSLFSTADWLAPSDIKQGTASGHVTLSTLYFRAVEVLAVERALHFITVLLKILYAFFLKVKVLFQR